MPNIPQLLKWVGNKQKFSDEIISYFPRKFKNYYEPFLGSGAVLGNLCSQKYEGILGGVLFEQAFGSDYLPFLVEIFELVKNEPKRVIDHYRKNIEDYQEDRERRYLEIRERFNEKRNPLDFLLLSRTCYSGIIRFRKRDGFMSTPIGPHNPIPPEKFAEIVYTWNSVLEEANFHEMDYRISMERAGDNDLVYCDPPYTHSQKILYGAQSFKIEDLWEAIAAAKRRGAMVALSINGTKKSKSEDIGVTPPEGLFSRSIYIDCGHSMVNRLQRNGQRMVGEGVHDLLLLTW